MRPNPNDPEIRTFIMTCGLGTYSLISTAIAGRFDQRWPVDMIRTVRGEFPSRIYSRFQADPAVVAFVADRVGLTPLDTILSEGRVQFGHHRFPGRSALGRMLEKIRAETPMIADGIVGPDAA